jgi:putative flippase GtrA
MFKWRGEWGYLGRYIGSGAANTLIGFVVIFSTMWLGFTPLAANISGYAVGFILGFLVSKKLVFRSDGNVVKESIRYLVAFFLAFGANLATLSIALDQLNLRAIPAQLWAGGVYTCTMYILSRHYVFRDKATQRKTRAS